ncbi:MAG TPA: cation:proton antiporter [Solirubrobacteraceae bacterium]|nr:cation:proton antiporter [Solirubrobacteraceae bacterium]
MIELLLAADTGFSFAGTFPIGLLFVGIAVFAAVGAMSHEHERAFSASLIYLGLGALAALAIQVLEIGWLDPTGDDAKLVEHVAEVALIFALFSSGLKLDRELRWREWSSVTRLLALTMPLTMAGVALFASQVMGLSLAAALLLGAVLSPTDPVLAGDIGVGPPGDEAEHEPNFALTAEAGGNDGLAAPLVVIGVFVAEQGGTDWIGEWLLADLAYPILAGVAIGAAVGLAAAWSVKGLRDRELLAPGFDGYHAIATALVTYGVAETAGAYGFLAVFAGGLAFRRYEHDHELNANAHRGAEQVEKFMELAAILMLGSLLSSAGLGAPGWEGWLLAVVLLVVIRPLSTLISLLGSNVEGKESRTFVAWFGVRGVGTLYYASTIVTAGVLSDGEQRVVVWTAIACVIVSIVVHGITGGPALRRLLATLRQQPAPEPATPPAR